MIKASITWYGKSILSLTCCLLPVAFLIWSSAKGHEINAGSLKYPWTGGLNSCQYGSIDLNGDGIRDLVIFDRHGNRILPFINDGTPGLNGYSFHPEYVKYFPDLHDWVIFKDYDYDGNQDNLTYSSG